MRILVTLDSIEGTKSRLSEHFGRCRGYCIIDTKSGELRFIEKKLRHDDPILTPIDQIMEFEPDMIFSLGLGKKAMHLLKEKNVSVKTGDFRLLREVMDNLYDLEDLADSCNELQ